MADMLILRLPGGGIGCPECCFSMERENLSRNSKGDHWQDFYCRTQGCSNFRLIVRVQATTTLAAVVGQYEPPPRRFQ